MESIGGLLNRVIRRGEPKRQPAQEATTEHGGGQVTEYFQLDPGGVYQHTTDILYTDQNGRQFRFSGLLPEGWRFLKGIESTEVPDFEAKKEEKTIKYGNLHKTGSLLYVLHEIGHARSSASGNKDRNELHDPIKQYTNDYANRALTKEDIISRGENPDDYEYGTVWDSWGRDGSGNDPVFSVLIPKSLIYQYGRAHAKEERNAWAYALLQLRKLRQEGFIIEPAFSGVNSLKADIQRNLATYAATLKRD